MQSMIKLNNGVEIPGVGLGVFRAVDGDETRNSVKGIEAGSPSYDTATCYRNEKASAMASEKAESTERTFS